MSLQLYWACNMTDGSPSKYNLLKQSSFEQLDKLMSLAQTEDHVEIILKGFSSAALDILGDPLAKDKPGNLKNGEHQFSVAGFFLHIAEKRENLLVAEQGFPKEQHRLIIQDDVGHPGWVTANKKPLLLSNTDEHPDFKQILKTARMGSAMYSPMLWQGKFIGQFITASQARNTYNIQDHHIHQVFANSATIIFTALNGSSLGDTAPR